MGPKTTIVLIISGPCINKGFRASGLKEFHRVWFCQASRAWGKGSYSSQTPAKI